MFPINSCSIFMKPVKFLIILTVFLTWASSYTINTANAVSEEKKQISVSSSTYSEAQLLQSYVSKYRKNINWLYSEVHLEQSDVMKRANNELLSMIFSLNRIKEWFYSEDSANILMKKIVSDIRILNTRLKRYIEEEQMEQEIIIKKKQIQYSVIWQRIAYILDSMIERLSTPLVKKNELSETDKILVDSLIKIQNENKNIKSFSQKTFWSQSEMQEYFQQIIRNIRIEMQNLKNNS